MGVDRFFATRLKSAASGNKKTFTDVDACRTVASTVPGIRVPMLTAGSYKYLGRPADIKVSLDG